MVSIVWNATTAAPLGYAGTDGSFTGASGTLNPTNATDAATFSADINSYYSTSTDANIRGLYQKIGTTWTKVSATTARRFKMSSSPTNTITPIFGDEWANTGPTQVVLGISIPAGATSVWNGSAWDVISSVSLSGSGVPAPGLGKAGDTYFDTNSTNYYEKTNTTTWSIRANYLTSYTQLNEGSTLQNTINTTAANNAAIADMASDSILSPVEKLSIRVQWDAIEKDRLTLLNSTTGTEYDNFITAVAALGTYLNGGTSYTGWGSAKPYLINDVYISTPFAITASSFRNYFEVYYAAKIALMKKLTGNAQAAADDRLSKSVSNVLSGSGQIVAGSTFNGVVLSSTGLAGVKAGVYTFSIDTNGNAIFKGDLTGSTGMFAGSLSSVTGSFGAVTVENSLTVSGLNSKITSAALTNFSTANQSGFFLGYDSTAYKFKVGSNDGSGNLTKGIAWDGANFSVKGEVIATENLQGNAVDSTKLATAVINSITTAGTTATWSGVSGVSVSTDQIQADATTVVSTVSVGSILLNKPTQQTTAYSASLETPIVNIAVPSRSFVVKTIVFVSFTLKHFDSSSGYLLINLFGLTYTVDVMTRLLGSDNSSISQYTLQFVFNVPANTSSLGTLTVVEKNGANATQFWDSGSEYFTTTCTTLSILR